MPGGKGGPRQGMGSGFLRSKADKRGIDGLIAFIRDTPVSRRENVISMVVEEDQEGAGTREVTIPGTG
jgi:predicted transcriptional regulator